MRNELLAANPLATGGFAAVYNWLTNAYVYHEVFCSLKCSRCVLSLLKRVSVAMLLLLSCRESIAECADVTPSLESQLLNIIYGLDKCP